MKLKNAIAALAVGVAVASTSHAESNYRFQLYVPGIQAATNTAAASGYTYATLNPSDKASGATLSNGNLTDSSTNGSGVRGTIGKSAGKWYFEVTVDTLDGGLYPPVVGIASKNISLASSWMAGPGEYVFYGWRGVPVVIYGANQRINYGSGVSQGDVIGVAIDLDALQITYYLNGVSMGAAFTSLLLTAGTYYPYVSDPYYTGYSSQETVNFGQSAFQYSPPVGYNAGWYQ